MLFDFYLDELINYWYYFKSIIVSQISDVKYCPYQ